MKESDWRIALGCEVMVAKKVPPGLQLHHCLPSKIKQTYETSYLSTVTYVSKKIYGWYEFYCT